MSRIGKQQIILTEAVSTKFENNKVTVKGPKGELSYQLSPLIKITQEDNIITLKKIDGSPKAQELYGLSRTLINNMVIGVSEGFSKKLEIQGVGYRSQMDGKNLVLNVGFSHPITITPPEGIIIRVENNTNIIISGVDKALVGQIAAKIRQTRPPEPYKGKGIRYQGEHIVRKIGKAGK